MLFKKSNTEISALSGISSVEGNTMGGGDGVFLFCLLVLSRAAKSLQALFKTYF